MVFFVRGAFRHVCACSMSLISTEAKPGKQENSSAEYEEPRDRRELLREADDVPKVDWRSGCQSCSAKNCGSRSWRGAALSSFVI